MSRVLSTSTMAPVSSSQGATMAWKLSSSAPPQTARTETVSPEKSPSPSPPSAAGALARRRHTR